MKVARIADRYWGLSKEYTREIFNASSLHGISHFVSPNRHYSETLFWMIVVMCAFFFFIQLALNILNRYLTSPTVISIDREVLSWNLTFPSATICFKEIDNVTLETIVNEYNVTDKDTLRKFLTQLAKFNMNTVTDEDIDDHPAVKPEDFLSIVERLTLPFGGEIISTMSEPVTIQKTIGELGCCYSLNSMVAIYASPKYWLKNEWQHVKQNSTHIHPMDGEQFIKVVDFRDEYEVYFHSPTEIPVLLYRNYGAELGTLNHVGFRMLSMFSDEGVRSLTPSQRHCRYSDERVLTRSPVYTYNMCIMECRVVKIQELCGCIPHFYRRLSNEKVCPASDLKCLHVYKSVMLERSRNIHCNCLPTCDDDIFTVYDEFVMPWDRWTEIKFGIKDFPKYRLKREVLFGITDVLVNCGGAAGLLLGSSVLSLVEIVYFAVLRLFWFCRRNR